ncbi:MAG: hypothetical protein R2774_05930 [Saprospiraceae bacterium]
MTNVSGNEYDIDFGSTATIGTSGFVLPPSATPSTAGMVLGIFSCPPTTCLIAPWDLQSDPCYLGIQVGNSINTVNNGMGVSGSYSTVYAVYFTFDAATGASTGPDLNSDGCLDHSEIYQFNYLPPPSPCDCASGNSCGGMHYDCIGDAQSDYPFGGGTTFFNPPLPATNGASYQFCYEYTTASDETSIGFVNLVGTNGNNCLTKTYEVYPANNCSSPLTPTGASNFGSNGFEYDVSPNTAYVFCVTIMITNNNCTDVIDNTVWLYNNSPSQGCGTCSSPCTDSGMGQVSTYADRTYQSCWSPDCTISGPTSFTNCFEATADGTGFLGFANTFSAFSSSCISIAWELTQGCSAPIPNPVPNAHNVGSGFNPEYSGLTPNETYVLCVTYTIASGSICNFDQGDIICIDAYGTDCNVLPIATPTQPTCGQNNGSIIVLAQVDIPILGQDTDKIR